MLIGVILIILIGFGFYAFGTTDTVSDTATTTIEMQNTAAQNTQPDGTMGQTTTKTTVTSTTTSTSTSTASTKAAAGAHCGGNSANAKQCIVGYHCAPMASSSLPFGDVGGVCVSN